MQSPGIDSISIYMSIYLNNNVKVVTKEQYLDVFIADDNNVNLDK